MAYYSNNFKIAEGGKIISSALGITVEAFITGWLGSSSTLSNMSESVYTWTVPPGISSFTAYVWGGVEHQQALMVMVGFLKQHFPAHLDGSIKLFQL